LDFYESCYSEVNETVYPLIYQLQNFNYFQQQSCVESAALLEASSTEETLGNGNCVNLLYQSLQSNGLNFSIPILSPTCDYTEEILQSFCVAFSSMGCCYANQAAIFGHTQFNDTNLEFFPACLHKYLKHNCASTPNPNDFCTQGSQTNLTVLTGSFNLGTSLDGTDVFGTPLFALTLPSVYDFGKTAPAPGADYPPGGVNTSVTILQSIIGGTLMSPDNNGMYWKPVTEPFTTVVVDPAGSIYGVNVQILDYTYYNGQTGEKLVTNYNSGRITADYEEAFSTGGTISFDFQAVFSNLSPDQVETMERRLTCTDPNSPQLDQVYYANCLTTLLTNPVALQNPATIGITGFQPGFSTPPGFSYMSISNTSADLTYPLQQSAAYYPGPVANESFFVVPSDQFITHKNGASSLRVSSNEIIILIVFISSFSLII
jgi:hypothetical protein